jgi:DNA sulfur modification protein DndB
MRPPEARAEFVHSHAVAFWALATAGRQLIEQHSDEADWKGRLELLSTIDWRKTNPDWQGLVMLGSDIITRRQTREAMSKYIAWHLGIESERPTAVLVPA